MKSIYTRIAISTALLLVFFLPDTSAQTGGIPTGTDTNCTGGYLLFQRTYGGNKDDYAYSTAVTADSGYVIAGHTLTYGSGNYDGLLMKVNKKGTTVWSRALGGSGNDVFYKVVRTSDNGFIACGQTKSHGNPAGDAWLVKTDAAGTVQWSKKYGDGNANGEISYDVIQLSDGGYALCGAHPFAPGVAQSLVIRTDNQGNVLWSKQYGVSGSDDATGLLEDGNSLLVTGFYQGFSFYEGFLMKLDKATGAMQWVRGYDADNRSTWFSKINKTNSGYQVLSVITDNYGDQNQQQCIWNINTDGTVQNVRKMSIPSNWSIGVGWHTLPDGGFIGANSENSNTSDVIISRVDGSGALVWSNKYVRTGKQLINAIVPSPEGGYAGAGIHNIPGTVADSNDVFLIRLDSLGNGGACLGAATIDVTVSSPFVSTYIPALSDLGTVNMLNPVITTAAISFSPGARILCYYCRIPVVLPPPDTICTNGLAFFQKAYGGNKDDYGYSTAVTADSGYVMAGYTMSYGSGNYDGLLMKVNKKGTTVWSRAIGGSGYDVFYKVVRTSDNGFIACGQTKSHGNPAGDAWLVKTDAAGTVQWSKKYGDGNVSGEISFDVIQLSDGGYALCGVHPFAPGVAQSLVIRTDNQGNVLWSKQYGVSGSDDATGLLEDGNSLLVVGFYQGVSFYEGFLMKLDKATGAMQWVRGYDADNRSTWFSKINKTNSGYQVLSVITDNYGDQNQQQCIWNLNIDGTVQNVRKLSIPSNWSISAGWHTLPDGGFIGANSANNSTSDVIFSRVNASGNLVWSNKFIRVGKQLINAIAPSPEGGYAGVGTHNIHGSLADSNELFIIRMDSLGNGGKCLGTPTTEVTVSSPFVSTYIPALSDLGTVNMLNPVITTGVVNFTAVTNTLCFYCKPKPTGADRSFTDVNLPHKIKVFPNPVTGRSVNLLIEADHDDRAVVSIVDLNGNLISILSSREISKGNNLIKLDLPARLQPYSNYYIQVKYPNSLNAVLIFVANQ